MATYAPNANATASALHVVAPWKKETCTSVVVAGANPEDAMRDDKITPTAASGTPVLDLVLQPNLPRGSPMPVS
jgi:hypothetical protein